MLHAIATGGAFPVACPAEVVAEDAVGRGQHTPAGGTDLVAAAELTREWGAAAGGLVRWAGLKPSARAMEKLVSCALPEHKMWCAPSSTSQ
jgi:hypothetical protein